jgi:hypothetical protein
MTCSVNSDCQYGNCFGGICTAPSLACPTDDPDTICSGQGTCVYSDLSGAILSSCSILDTSCTAACLCSGSYGGVDCTLSGDETVTADSVRTDLCTALVTAASLQDSSSSLLATLVASLISSFSPYEIVSEKGKGICATVLTVLTTLASSGNLDGATSQSLVKVISLFTTTTTTDADRRLTSSNASQYPVDPAVTGLVQGIILGMADGEEPVSLVTDNVQISVFNQLVTDLTSTTFISPATESQATYGTIQPKISLGVDGLSKCPSLGGYAQLSVLQWGKNPYKGSTAVQSPLLKFSVASTSTSSTTKAPTNAPTTPTSRRLLDSVTFTLPSNPAYYISLQFLSTQDFNFTAGSLYSSTSAIKSNFSLPACTLYNGLSYVPCQGCNISSYTNYNVTYSCFDITQICPPTTASVTRSLSEGYDVLAEEDKISKGE